MSFFQLWLTGYVSPSRAIEGLRDKPAPHWGFCAQALRALLNSLLLYLPLALMGRQPSMPSYLTFLTEENYFLASVFFVPALLIGQWLLLCAVVHLILRLLGRRSDIDQILNITGLVALIVGAVLIAWDWIWILMDWHNYVWLGISHLVIVTWAVAITMLAFKRILGVPYWLGLLLNILWLALGEPLGALFMRAPI
jgi:hypothetical protein